MASPRVLFYASIFCAVQIFHVSAQSCDLPVFEEMDELLQFALEGFLGRLSPRVVGVNSSLERFSLTCLSVSEIRDQFRLATSLIEFSFTSEPSISIDGCGQMAQCFALFNIECDDTMNFWIVNSVIIDQSLRILEDFDDDSLFDEDPRLDCGGCNERLVVSDPSAEHDPETNCFCEFIIKDFFFKCFKIIMSTMLPLMCLLALPHVLSYEISIIIIAHNSSGTAIFFIIVD